MISTALAQSIPRSTSDAAVSLLGICCQPSVSIATSYAEIQNAISATAISERMEDIPFRDSREWLIGAIVATGDMLGQMAAEDYPERLAGLYLEFREATHFSRFQKTSFAVHKNLLDLLEGTEKFFNGYVMRMLEQEWNGIYRVLDDRRGKNCYIERIRANISRVNLMARSLAASHREPVTRRF